ncbi:hypothetical protein B0H11DRAFT_479756 [Mycena galericulata]|nr:hypothetical protein B0H11DRAFT_479756 [Mycena galericulata]
MIPHFYGVHVQVRGRRCPGLAVSDRIPLSPSSVDGGRSQSLATLLLGLLIPPHIVPDPPRDPAMHARPEDWTFIIKNLPGDRGRGGGRGKGRGGSGGGGRSGSGGGGGGRGGAQDRRHRRHGGGGRREGEGEGDNRGDCPSNHQIALEPGTPMLIRRRESEAFGGPLPLVVVECNDIEEHWTRGPPFDDQDTASGGSSSRSASPVPSHTSRSTVASESSQEGSCATAPSSICTPHSPANVPTIELTSTIHTAELADVARATFHKDGQTSHAVLKTYDATGFRQVVAETLRDLQGTTVAAQIGIIAPLHWTWVGLLMEDAGDPLGCGEDWAALGPLDRKLIYTALVKIHETGVQHGDVAPRNVVRRPDGGIAFIDFGCAEQHRCPGRDACRELLEMEKELHLT